MPAQVRAPRALNTRDQPVAKNPKSPTENVQEVLDLVKAYAIQETAGPLKGVGTYLKWGVPGAVFIGLGLFFLALSLLRGLQTIDIFNGDDGEVRFVWAPYLIVVALAAVILGFLITRITKGLDT